MLARGPSLNRIFISYRRDDTQGYAGRLEDSLAAHFGADRVFRDVGSIEAGADFAEVVKHELEDSGAVIVLIGPTWLTAARDGRARLGEDKDYVSLEIATALGRGIPVIPVLVENTNMPREEELPDSLKSLAQRNAISISDERWNADVTRLARIVAIDVPGSVAERKLNRLLRVALVLLVASLVGTSSIFAWTAYVSACTAEEYTQDEKSAHYARDGAEVTEQPFRVARGDVVLADTFTAALAAAAFLLISAACLLLMVAAKHVDGSKLRSFQLCIWVGLCGTAASFVFYGVTDEPGDIIAMAPACALTSGAVLALLARSGFKAS